jgi:hypothetical protein
MEKCRQRTCLYTTMLISIRCKTEIQCDKYKHLFSYASRCQGWVEHWEMGGNYRVTIIPLSLPHPLQFDEDNNTHFWSVNSDIIWRDSFHFLIYFKIVGSTLSQSLTMYSGEIHRSGHGAMASWYKDIRHFLIFLVLWIVSGNSVCKAVPFPSWTELLSERCQK